MLDQMNLCSPSGSCLHSHNVANLLISYKHGQSLFYFSMSALITTSFFFLFFFKHHNYTKIPTKVALDRELLTSRRDTCVLSTSFILQPFVSFFDLSLCRYCARRQRLTGFIDWFFASPGAFSTEKQDFF